MPERPRSVWRGMVAAPALHQATAPMSSRPTTSVSWGREEPGARAKKASKHKPIPVSVRFDCPRPHRVGPLGEVDDQATHHPPAAPHGGVLRGDRRMPEGPSRRQGHVHAGDRLFGERQDHHALLIALCAGSRDKRSADGTPPSICGSCSRQSARTARRSTWPAGARSPRLPDGPTTTDQCGRLRSPRPERRGGVRTSTRGTHRTPQSVCSPRRWAKTNDEPRVITSATDDVDTDDVRSGEVLS